MTSIGGSLMNLMIIYIFLSYVGSCNEIIFYWIWFRNMIMYDIKKEHPMSRQYPEIKVGALE